MPLETFKCLLAHYLIGVIMTVYLSDQIPMKAIIGKVEFDMMPISSEEAKKELTVEPCQPKWEYNKYGHVLITHCDCSEDYLQIDTDVEAFFENIGVNPDTLSSGDEDTLNDDPYFEGECKSKIQDFVNILTEDRKAVEETVIQLTGSKEIPMRQLFDKVPEKMAKGDIIIVAQPTPPGPVNFWKVNIL
jgi:hypothetical protein